MADLRAPTPSAAAELAIPNITDVKENLNLYNNRLKVALKRKVELLRANYEKVVARRAFSAPLQGINEKYMLIDMKVKTMQSSIQIKIKEEKTRFVKVISQLDALSPLKTLSRGYGIITLENGEMVKSVNQLAKDDKVGIKLADGTVNAKII